MRAPLVAAAALACALLALDVTRAPAAVTAPPIAVAAQDSAAPSSPVVAPQPGGGLPQRAPEPRTMREFWPFFTAFVLAWVVLVAVALRLGTPYGRLAERVGRLKDRPSGPS